MEKIRFIPLLLVLLLTTTVYGVQSDDTISYKGFMERRSASVAVSTEDTGITITAERNGKVRRIWIYVDGGDASSSNQVDIYIYRNKEATASTIIPYEEFFALQGIGASVRTGVWVTTFIQDSTNFIYSADIAVEDLFTKQWKIAVKNNSGTQTATVEYIVHGFFF